MTNELSYIIKNKAITTVFQAILNVQNQSVVGYEALTRGPKGSLLSSPDQLFQHATQAGLLSELEILCRDNAINKFAELKLSGKLFLNISPLVLLSKNHPQGETIKLVEKAGLNCQQIVIELSEKHPFPNNSTLRAALDKYRKFGFNVAIDDLGTGYSGLKVWSQLLPNIVKIDRYFVDNCHNDSFKQKFLKAMFDLATAAEAEIVVEGIECSQEYDFLLTLGMTYAQGFYLAKPELEPIRRYPEHLITPYYLPLQAR